MRRAVWPAALERTVIMLQSNRFGSGELFSIEELLEKSPNAKVYCESTACMSVTSDMWSFASANRSINWTTDVTKANIVIVLGCQVTDLAILNDIAHAETLHVLAPKAQVYMGGCLAQRFDIELPEFIRRLDVSRAENEPIYEPALDFIVWQRPFWVQSEDWKPGNRFGPGQLFRDMYPLKIGAGCHRKCKYCTIRDTRGPGYEIEPQRQVNEFLDAVRHGKQVVLVSDSPSVEQIKGWADIALYWGKPLSIRNIEPQVAVQCQEELLDMAEAGLLPIFHRPIQSNIKAVLQDMGRDYGQTMEAVELMQRMRALDTKVATNIIIDYQTQREFYHNMDVEWLNAHFDYWSWNPYFDGLWSRAKARKRFLYYLETKMLPGEIRFEDAVELICTEKLQDGGMPRWMATDSFIPNYELLRDRCAERNIRIAFIKE